ncbi:MAG: dienelactone hydrolase family protein [Reyranellaceae bacterium]
MFHYGSPLAHKSGTPVPRSFNPKPLAEWFVARGWAVVLPQRRGLASPLATYDEGLDPRQPLAGACDPEVALGEADRVLGDVDSVTASVLALPFVDRGRLAVGGQSRGGALAVAWSGRKPGIAKAVVNFSGLWLGPNCWSADEVNQALFKIGVAAKRPSLWLYGERDPYLSVEDARRNFAAFQNDGGEASFFDFTPPYGTSGHDIVLEPKLWARDVERYLKAQGLPLRAVAP